jgi:D-3-phosphoglycerate dehydrogenase
VEAVLRRAGAEIGDAESADALVWLDSNPATFPQRLAPSVRWVQLPSAGIEAWFGADRLDAERVWTTAAGAYADAVAEHALALLLAGVHRLPDCIRARSWERAAIDPLVGTIRSKLVAIVGAGGIGRALIVQLRALGADVIAVTRSGTPVEGAVRTLPIDRASEVWALADHVVIAAPATPETLHLVGRTELEQMKETAWLVNIARGSLIDTEALTAALAAGSIAGAALDVTDPEPLPDGHPLWDEPRAIITPHIANPRSMLREALLRRIEDNATRFLGGRPLLATVDLVHGY